MGSLWRSEPMQLIQLFVQVEAARDTVDELGQLGVIQFRDMNPEVSAFQRHFVSEVKRFDEMERKIRYFNNQLVKANLKDDYSFRYFDETFQTPSNALSIDELETKFEELEKEIEQMNANQDTLERNQNELLEMLQVLENDSFFFDETDIQKAEQTGPLSQGEGTPLVQGGRVAPAPTRGVSLGFITGVARKENMVAFEKVLWRATRGNLFMKQYNIPIKLIDAQSGQLVEKTAFIIFFQGERVQVKVKKISESFGANLYLCPDSRASRLDMRNQVANRLNDLKTVLMRTADHSRRVLTDVAINLDFWRAQVLKEKSIYHTMNLFNYDVGRKCLIAEGWCPTTATEEIQRALKRATKSSGALVPSILSIVRTRDVPPTYFQTNKFTTAFQAIVEAYGIARYQEINPTVFTIVTFPFLFGVMFGDFGHGLILTAVAALFVYYEKSLSGTKLNEMVRTCFDGRYVLILMGIFSTYVGLIYNEAFAVPMDIFGSRWHVDEHTGEATWPDGAEPYPFGVDPIWKVSRNELYFYNSLKMKLSILLGVTQMVLGIVMTAFNAVHFRRFYALWCEFIPQMLFMVGVFGYMCFLIILKWSIDFEHSPPQTLEGSGAPSILNLMITMFLAPFPSMMTPQYHLFPGQPVIQFLIIIVALVSVPWMLLAKPLYLKKQHEKKAAHAAGYEGLDDESHDTGGGHGGHEGFEFGEEMVHQSIHTIEFVLGAVSNTASYLRLWALSLAHAELSKVFLEMIVIAALELHGGLIQVVALFIAFGAWAGLSIGVLLLMESLSAFLHALRLHWVEFQNKFYAGDGYAFAPFAYSLILACDDD